MSEPVDETEAAHHCEEHDQYDVRLASLGDRWRAHGLIAERRGEPERRGKLSSARDRGFVPAERIQDEDLAIEDEGHIVVAACPRHLQARRGAEQDGLPVEVKSKRPAGVAKARALR